MKGELLVLLKSAAGYEWKIIIHGRATIEGEDVYSSERSAKQAAKAFAKRCGIELTK